MEYIKVEEFLKQDEEVQKVFLDWFEQEITECDLIGYIGKSPTYQKSFPYTANHVAIDCFEMGKEIIPLLTEGQLRQFIEDKTKCKVVPDLFGKEEYVIGLFYRGKNCFLDKADYSNLGTDLLQAYWKVAIEIIKEEIK